MGFFLQFVHFIALHFYRDNYVVSICCIYLRNIFSGKSGCQLLRVLAKRRRIQKSLQSILVYAVPGCFMEVMVKYYERTPANKSSTAADDSEYISCHFGTPTYNNIFVVVCSKYTLVIQCPT